MFTYLEILSGPEQGQIFRVRTGLRLGSGDCEVRITDPLIPPLHSQVLYDNRDQLVLVCTNAVYEIHINDNIVRKIVLDANLSFRVGITNFKIHTSSKQLVGALDPLKHPFENEVQSRTGKNPAMPSQNESRQASGNSKKKLSDDLKKLIDTAKGTPSPVKLFKRPVCLKVETGPQADDEFIVSWGPRDFGPKALEFPIEFPPFPGILFTLTPGANGEILFSTKQPKFCRVSGQGDSSCVIQPGDKIEAGDSTILVDYLKDLGK